MYPSLKNNNYEVQETVGAMSDLIRQGKVRYLGLSEASANIIPIPGTKKIRYLDENAAAVDLRLTPEDLKRITTISMKQKSKANGMRDRE